MNAGQPARAAGGRDEAPCIAGLHEIAGGYDAILCDVWGVLIDGKRHFPRAAQAMKTFRERGGTVVLITNASRPDAEVRRQLLGLGLPQDAFDDLVSAGELTLREIVARKGQVCHHLGPPRDKGLFEEAGRRLGAPLPMAGPQEADFVVCTGLDNEREERPEDYDARLAAMRARSLPMLCANPDIVVHVGADLLWCAGALAERYAAMGGEVFLYGKPHPPIYREALARIAASRGAAPPLSRVLAIGDGAETDLAGAARAGIGCLFVTDGIHKHELRGEGGALDRRALGALFCGAKARPIALASEVFW